MFRKGVLTQCTPLSSKPVLQDPEYGQSTLHRTVGNYLPVKMVLTFPEDLKSPSSLLWIISANGVLSWYPTMEAA
jgi:hypothetical protein